LYQWLPNASLTHRLEKLEKGLPKKPMKSTKTDLFHLPSFSNDTLGNYVVGTRLV